MTEPTITPLPQLRASVRLKGTRMILKLGEASTEISAEDARQLAHALLSRISEVEAKDARDPKRLEGWQRDYDLHAAERNRLFSQHLEQTMAGTRGKK